MRDLDQNNESFAIKNGVFRQVIYTERDCQLAVMALRPNEEMGVEVHPFDQFFRVEAGTGEAVLDGVRTAIGADFAMRVPAEKKYNIINTGSVPLKLYLLVTPPNYLDVVVQTASAEAEADKRRFEGEATG